MKKKLIFIVGKTSTGKDTICKYIQDKYGVSFVCSYTTRPKREYEVDGVQHRFVTPEEMKRIAENDDIIAYTKFPKTGFEYCATANSIDGDVALYIINPDGIRWFKENGCFDSVDFSEIYLHANEETIIRRAISRKDNIDDIKARLDSEREDMDRYFNEGKYDYVIDTSMGLGDVFRMADIIMKELGVVENVVS